MKRYRFADGVRKKVQQTRLNKNKVTKRLRVKGGNVLTERGQISGVHSQQTEEVHARRHTDTQRPGLCFHVFREH